MWEFSAHNKFKKSKYVYFNIHIFFYFSVKNENIYEEIQEVRQDSSSGSNTDSGIGVTSKSFCTSSAGSSSMPCSKGTLDVKKKVQNQNNLHNKPPREPVKPMSSLDALLCQTTLTADQRWSQ